MRRMRCPRMPTHYAAQAVVGKGLRERGRERGEGGATTVTVQSGNETRATCSRDISAAQSSAKCQKYNCKGCSQRSERERGAEREGESVERERERGGDWLSSSALHSNADETVALKKGLKSTS